MHITSGIVGQDGEAAHVSVRLHSLRHVSADVSQRRTGVRASISQLVISVPCLPSLAHSCRHLPLPPPPPLLPLPLQGRAAAAVGAGGAARPGGRMLDRQAQGAAGRVGAHTFVVGRPRRVLPQPAAFPASHESAPRPQAHFASTGPKKTAAQVRAQQADLMSKLPQVRAWACSVVAADSRGSAGAKKVRGGFRRRSAACPASVCRAAASTARSWTWLPRSTWWVGQAGGGGWGAVSQCQSAQCQGRARERGDEAVVRAASVEPLRCSAPHPPEPLLPSNPPSNPPLLHHHSNPPFSTTTTPRRSRTFRCWARPETTALWASTCTSTTRARYGGCPATCVPPRSRTAAGDHWRCGRGGTAWGG